VNDAKAPEFKMGLEDAEGRVLEPDWSVVVGNQFTEITQNSAIRNQKRMIRSWKVGCGMHYGEAVDMVDAIKMLAEEMDKGG
jgi:hypothetical protein